MGSSCWLDGFLQLRAAIANGDMPRDVGAFCLREIVDRTSHHNRIVVRDYLIVAASRFLDGSMWARSGSIAEDLRSLERRHGVLGNPVRQLLSEAQTISPIPKTQRQIFSIICDSESAAVPISDVLRAESIS